MKRRLLLLAFVLVTVSACGGSPTSPSNRANYSGNWSGTYTITGCNQTGGIALANICGSLGGTPPYSMQLTQSAANASGTFTLGTITFPQTGGTVGADGSLQLNGTTQSSGITIIVQWNLRLTGNQMSGSISQNWSSTTLSGQATVAGTISTAVR